MNFRCRHYAGRTADILINVLVPRRFRLPFQFHKYTLLLRWEPEVRLIRRFAKHSAVAIDVGANVGLWSYAMVRSGLFHRILAFEPNAALTADLESMCFPCLTVRHQAISNVAGRSLLRIPRYNNALLEGWASLEDQIDVATDDFKEMIVETIRLDDLSLNGVGFIKIDVEGHEMRLFEGARDFFTTNRPTCLVECRERNHSQVEAFFSGLHVGYQRIDTRSQFGFGLSPGNVLFAVQ